jgi:hypothetical protein
MHKFCTVATTLGWKGQSVDLHPSQVWDANDPLVRAHPEYFSDVPAVLQQSTGVVRRGVEQASAAPGEKRAASR